MELFLPIIFLLCTFQNILGQWTQQDDELSYQDIINVHGSCYPLDSCNEDRTDDLPIPSFGYTCSCNRQCWEFGTCCIDSPYRDKPATHKCRNTGGPFYTDGYYIIDKCPDNTPTDSIWKSQCEKEWSEEYDILLLSPLTSLDTSVTYKNYFCFRCHEKTDKYISWNLFVESTYTTPRDMNISSVSYNQEQKKWVAIFDSDHISIPVNVTFIKPYDLQAVPFNCDLDTIADCPNTWTDRRVHEKCLSYTAVVYVGYSSYKNIHCALCNHASLDFLSCNQTVFGGLGGKEFFSFKHLLNINDSDGDKVGDDGKCESDHVWDPYSKKCRKKTCAVPGYVLQDDKCVPP